MISAPSTTRLRAPALPPGVRSPSLALLGLGLLVVEIAVDLAGGSVGVALALLVVAPGLALAPLLPDRVRRQPLTLLAAAPALGFAAVSVALISLARVGIPLEAWTARGAVALLCVVGLFLHDDAPRERPSLLEGAVVLLALGLGIVLQARVIGDMPAPGNDWAKYVLYADEIRRQGSLLIDNPFWMLGVPFREDPATPAVYGAALAMSGARAGALVQGIWLFAAMGILSTYAFVRAWWGAWAGCLAAALYAVLPVNQDILGWHGLANVAALAVVGIVLLFFIAVLRGEAGRRQLVGLALMLVAVAAAHRLTAVVTLAVLVLTAAVALVTARGRERRRLASDGALTAIFGLALGGLVLSDLAARQRTSGGTQPFEAYLNTKVDLALALRDLTVPFAVASAILLVALLPRLRRDRGLWPAFALLVVTVALAYAWLVEVPLSYLRMVYFLPLALVPVVAVGLAGRRATLALGAVLVGVMGALAWGQGDNVRRFYAFTDRASLRGLDVLAAHLRPREVVVTDRCWSFLATWLLHTRTLAALAPEDIGPAAEVPFARDARGVLDGDPSALRRARRLGVRFVLVDPTCVGADNRPLTPPIVGEPIYVSRRLAVLRLGS